jgi:hypothetical protein
MHPGIDHGAHQARKVAKQDAARQTFEDDPIELGFVLHISRKRTKTDNHHHAGF